MQEKILIIDVGSQYTQLIARRVREFNVFSQIVPFNKIPKITEDIKGIIISGSPFSVLDSHAPQIDLTSLLDKRPVLAICYGAQYVVNYFGGTVRKSAKREYGRAQLLKTGSSCLFESVDANSQVWMSHADTIYELPKDFEVIARTETIDIAAYQSKKDAFAHSLYGLQFHPEVTHSDCGKALIKDFISNVCRTRGTWTPASFVGSTVLELRTKIKQDKVILGLSGGVDSSVAAMLLHKAVGKNLYCIFVDNGLLRKNEFTEVLQSYENMGLQVKGVDASKMFLDALSGVSDPETKRKIIGKVFVDVFEKEAKLVQGATYLAQGTIYPDVIESVSVHGPSVTIKSHHNVGGLPEKLNLKIIEPLRLLFKDEVRKVGESMQMDNHILQRHPFPGPGLAIRILGDITLDKVRILQEADYIYVQNLKKAQLYNKVWQAGVILLPIKSVGVMGDERTYEHVVSLRAVSSVDGMTADWSHLPYDFLAHTSNEIINNVKGVNRVVYDISSKPPATIEWE